MNAVGRPQQPNAVRAAMLKIKCKVGQQEQCDQARPVVPRYRDRRQSDRVDPRGDHTEYEAMRGRLGQDVPNREQARNPGTFPGIVPVPTVDHDRLGEDGENEDRDESQTDLVGYFVQ